MSTASLRKDHDLIDKVLKAMETTIQLLTTGKKIPQSILLPTIDFTKNFTDVCHHSKEEKSLFPALGKAGMPTQFGPIAMMLMEHEMSREISKRMEQASNHYIQTNDPEQLISTMQEYVDHIKQHLWKENNRLFMMAESRLHNVSSQVDSELQQIEKSKLEEIGKSREEYEKLADDLTKNVSEIN